MRIPYAYRRMLNRSLTLITAAITAASLLASSLWAQFSPGSSGLENVSMTTTGTPAYRPIADTSTVVKHAVRECGPRRLCPKGWDLAAIGVETPGDVTPAEVPVGFRVTIANLGSAPSPAAPVRLTVGNESTDFLIPELASGDTLQRTVFIKLGGSSATQWITLTVDPELLSGEQNSDNNIFDGVGIKAEGKSDEKIDIPSVSFASDSIARGQPVRLRITVRNANRARPLVGALLDIKSGGYGVKETTARVELPAIPAMTDMTGEITLRGFTDHIEARLLPRTVYLNVEVTSTTGDGYAYPSPNPVFVVTAKNH